LRWSTKRPSGDAGGNGNSFAAWRDVTPHHNRMVEAILSYPGHVVVTMRSKMEYVLEEGPGGKKVPRKVGMAPVQRDGLEYEFTVVGDMDTDHNLIVTKSRCSSLADKVINRPGADMAKTLVAWLNDGAPAPQSEPATVEQVREIKELLSLVRMPEGIVEKWFAKAGVDLWEDMPAESVEKCIQFVKGRLPAGFAAA
jgi:hypothetical protein